jgi:general secretion pathway protein D
MNVKRFISVSLLLALVTVLGAQPALPPSASSPAAPAKVPPRPGPATRQAAPPAVPAAPAAGAIPTPVPKAQTQAAALPALPAAKPATPPGDVADISYNFPAIPVDQLLEIYSSLVGRTLLRASSGAAAVSATTTIALKTESPLNRSEAIEALETVLGMNGITIVPIGDKFAKVVTEAAAPQAGGVISSNVSLPEAGKFVTEILQVRYTAVQDLVEVLKPFSRMANSIIALPSTQTLVLRDYAENVERMLEMVKRIDVSSPLIIKPQVIPIKYALASDISAALGALGASGGTSVGKSSSGASFSTGQGGGRNGTTGIGGAGGGIGGIGGAGGGYPGQPTGGTSGLGSAATSARSSFQNNLQKIVANAAGGSSQFQLFGQTKIIADERTNSLLVFANDEDMKMIKDIIEKLDVVLAQVLIDAIIIEVNLQENSSHAVSYINPQQNSGNFSGIGGVNNLQNAGSFLGTGSSTATNGGVNLSPVSQLLGSLPSGFSYFSRFGNNLDLVLEALASDSRINVLSRPRIQTSHAVPADLFIGNTVPYVTGTYNYGYSSGPSSQYTQLEVGIHLQVLPLINPDGLVVMDIQADVEQLGPDVQIAGVGGVPTTTKRQAGAKVAVRDGETIVLSGFISDSRSKAVTGVPYLMNIPWFGNLFKGTTIQDLRTELIMLMRPTVLPTPAAAALVASAERNKLSAVKQAEFEIRQDERERNAAIDAAMARDAVKQAERDAAARKKAAQNSGTAPNDGQPTLVPYFSPAVTNAPAAH